ncbi:hypothetical protein IAU60_001943 [Kwoniella sp. DSM 27419]
MPLLTSRARLLTTLKPITLSVGFSFVVPLRMFGSGPPPTQPSCTRYLVRKASEMASRESPFPVVFVRARGLGLEEEGEWQDWSGMFAEKGYTAVEIDITAPSESAGSSTTESVPGDAPSPLRAMTSLLASQIRLMAIPFPPIVIAQGSSSLLAQAFIEDNPASGLVLIHPLPDEDPRTEAERQESGWAWPTFRYEPHFPLLVMSDQEGLRKLSVSNRLVREGGNGVSGQRGRGKGLEVSVLDHGELNERGRLDVERWMDRCGF